VVEQQRTKTLPNGHFQGGSDGYIGRELDGEFIQEVARHTVGLFRELSEHDAEDVSQEVALVLWEKRDKIGMDKALAYKIARDTAIDWLRKERRHQWL